MADLYFCVWEGGASATANGDPIQENKVAIGAVSAQSAAIAGTNRKRQSVRVFADGDCYVTWGANPTALNDGTNGRPVAAEVAEYFSIEAGHVIAVIERV